MPLTAIGASQCTVPEDTMLEVTQGQCVLIFQLIRQGPPPNWSSSFTAEMVCTVSYETDNNAVNVQQILKLTNTMHGSYTYGLAHFTTTDHGHNVKIKDTGNYCITE